MSGETPSPHGGGVRLKLRLRLGLLVSLLVAGAVVVTSWVALLVVQGVLERQYEGRIDASKAEVERRMQARGRWIRERVDGLSGYLLGDVQGLLVPMLDPRERSEPRVVDQARQMLNLSGLDVLEILDAGGRILSSGHWPEQFGKTDEDALRLPEDVAVFRRVRDARDEHLALVSRHVVRVGTREVTLIGGEFADESFLDGISGGRAALRLESVDGEIVREYLPPENGETTPAPGGDAVSAPVLRDPISLADAVGEPIARLRVTVSRRPLDALLVRMRWTFLGVAIIAVLAGGVAGSWIARRATRPVTEAVRAVDSIAAGEADYTFPHAVRDGLEALPEAFSRMRRSLDTQRRRAARAERVAAWREMARQVAHEVKNPLAPIRLTVENLIKARRRAPEMFDEVFEQGSRAILEEVGQLQRIVSDFSEFAKLPEPQMAPTDLDGVVASVIGLYSSEPGVRIEHRREHPLPPVSADAGLLSRAVRNVVANAVEATGEAAGTVTVLTGIDEGMAAIRVRDSGPGFSAEALDHLFEPYFTSKPSGTGLGMAIAYRIVTEHGGTVTAANRTSGAEVVLRIPIAGHDAAAAASTSTTEAS